MEKRTLLLIVTVVLSVVLIASTTAVALYVIYLSNSLPEYPEEPFGRTLRQLAPQELRRLSLGGRLTTTVSSRDGWDALITIEIIVGIDAEANELFERVELSINSLRISLMELISQYYFEDLMDVSGMPELSSRFLEILQGRFNTDQILEANFVEWHIERIN